MNCRSCNTRLPSSSGACPNCGHTQRMGKFLDSAEETPAPEDSGSGRKPLSPSSVSTGDDGETVDLDLDEEIELPLEQAVGKRSASASAAPAQTGRKPANPKKKEGKRAGRAGTKKAAPPPPDPNGSSGSAARPAAQSKPGPAAFVPMDPAQIRVVVAESPEVLEPGLSVYVDEDDNEVGAQFETEVGEIDLLARNESGEFVVVMVVAGDAGQEVVPDVLLRMGYVSKHVAGAANSGVRGMVLLEGVGDDLGYAAAAVSDRVDFRTWRMQLTFEALAD